jgi:hypothetical protein
LVAAFVFNPIIGVLPTAQIQNGQIQALVHTRRYIMGVVAFLAFSTPIFRINGN